MRDDVLSVKDVVGVVLREDVQARSDDKWLIFCVLRRLGFEVYIPFKRMKDMPAFESITRCRRKWQEEGLFLASDAVVRKRGEEREEMRQVHQWFDSPNTRGVGSKSMQKLEDYL